MLTMVGDQGCKVPEGHSLSRVQIDKSRSGAALECLQSTTYKPHAIAFTPVT